MVAVAGVVFPPLTLDAECLFGVAGVTRDLAAEGARGLGGSPLHLAHRPLEDKSWHRST